MQLNKIFYYLASTWSKKALTPITNPITYVNNSMLTQCNLALSFKYDGLNDICALITSCNKVSLNAAFCSINDTPVVCANTYHWGKHKFFNFLYLIKFDVKIFLIFINVKNKNLIDAFLNSCRSTCTNSNYRGPGSPTTSALCNTKCDTNYSKCENINSTELINLLTNYACKTGYDRVGYNCISTATSVKCNLLLAR